MAIKSSSIRPRDKNLKPQYIRSETRKTSKRGTSSPLIVVYGFLAIILMGALLLYLPFSNQENISFVDALFTSTSARHADRCAKKFTCHQGAVLAHGANKK